MKKLTMKSSLPAAKPVREGSPPGWYGRSKSGTTFRICRTSGRCRRTGAKLYRCEYLDLFTPVKSPTLWTIASLEEEGVQFLQRRPRDAVAQGGTPPKADLVARRKELAKLKDSELPADMTGEEMTERLFPEERDPNGIYLPDGTLVGMRS